MKEWKSYHVKDMAELFQLPVSTLHYWEKEQLIQANRTENQYRIYESRDFFDIWEIQLYRSLQVPVRELKQMKQKNVVELEQLLEEKQQVLEEELRQKQKILKKLKSYQEGIKVWEDLEKMEGEFLWEEPDVEQLMKDPLIKETMKQTIEKPYNCCVLFQAENLFEPEMSLPRTNHAIADPNWTKKKEENVKYLVLGIKTVAGRMNENTIQEKIKWIEEAGYQVNAVIARYLFTAAEEEKRYDYYKAWFELTFK